MMSMTEVVELIESMNSTEASVASGSTPASTAPAGEDIFVRISNGNEQGVQELITADGNVVHTKGPVSYHSPYIAYLIYVYIVIHVDLSSHIYFYVTYIQLNMTPLHYATAYNQAAIAKLLIKAGADPHVKCDVSTY